MPKGPRGEKRPADMIGTAIKVARISIGEEEDQAEPETTNPFCFRLSKETSD